MYLFDHPLHADLADERCRARGGARRLGGVLPTCSFVPSGRPRLRTWFLCSAGGRELLRDVVPELSGSYAEAPVDCATEQTSQVVGVGYLPDCYAWGKLSETTLVEARQGGRTGPRRGAERLPGDPR